MMVNYKYASMIENSRGQDWADHIKWLLRLEIIEVVR